MKILSAILIVICFVACGKKAEHRSESGKEINATDTVSVKNEKTTGDGEVFAWISAKSGLNLREEPRAESRSLTVIPFRELIVVSERSSKIVTIDGISDVWVKIRWNNYKGWLFNGYIAYSEKNIPVSKIFCTSISGKYSYGGAFIDFVGKTVCIMSWDTCEGVQKIELPYEIKDGMIIIPNEYTGDSYMLEMYDDNTVKFIKNWDFHDCDNISNEIYKKEYD